MKAKAILKDGKWLAVCHEDKSAILGEKRMVITKHFTINPSDLLLKKGQPYYNKEGERHIWISNDFDQMGCTRLIYGQDIEGELEQIPAPFGNGRECVVIQGNGKGKRGKITEMNTDGIKLDTFPDHIFKNNELKCLDTLQVFTLTVADAQLTDRALLPERYRRLAEEPVFEEAGGHSVETLERIIKQYQEYCKQQEVIKQNLKRMLQK